MKKLNNDAADRVETKQDAVFKNIAFTEAPKRRTTIMYLNKYLPTSMLKCNPQLQYRTRSHSFLGDAKATTLFHYMAGSDGSPDKC